MATKNNLDIGEEAPHHTELSNRYRINGEVYDLSQVIATARGDATDVEWNDQTMTERLATIKAYLSSVNAEKVHVQENTSGDGTGSTVKDGEGNVIEHAEQSQGSDGGASNEPQQTGNATASENDEQYKALESEAEGLRGPVSELQDALDKVASELKIDPHLLDPARDEGVSVYDAIAEAAASTTKQIADVREKLGLTDDTADIISAVDDLSKKASEAEQRATVAEQDASQLRQEVRTLRERATRGPALHGHIDELKTPY